MEKSAASEEKSAASCDEYIRGYVTGTIPSGVSKFQNPDGSFNFREMKDVLDQIHEFSSNSPVIFVNAIWYWITKTVGKSGPNTLCSILHFFLRNQDALEIRSGPRKLNNSMISILAKHYLEKSNETPDHVLVVDFGGGGMKGVLCSRNGSQHKILDTKKMEGGQHNLSSKQEDFINNVIEDPENWKAYSHLKDLLLQCIEENDVTDCIVVQTGLIRERYFQALHHDSDVKAALEKYSKFFGSETQSSEKHKVTHEFLSQEREASLEAEQLYTDPENRSIIEQEVFLMSNAVDESLFKVEDIGQLNNFILNKIPSDLEGVVICSVGSTSTQMYKVLENVC